MRKIRIKVNKRLGRQAEAGTVVEVAADQHGTPLDQFWRRRLRDAQRDHCCEVVIERPRFSGERSEE